MKNLVYTLLLAMLIMSCNDKIDSSNEGSFVLLPTPQSLEFNGSSDLRPSDIKNIWLHGDIKLPVIGEILKDIQISPSASKAQVELSIDSSLNVDTEGYTLDINQDKVVIIGKDNAGLFYGLKTLEQLMQDAKEQNVSLPNCSVKDYPLLAFRAVHIDVKHHLEKLDYYYQLMDRLASYKINGIIAEVEDKMGYESQPLVASEDAMSIAEWKKLSDYAKERNIEISPLVQGLGHASFILKHDKYKDLRDDPKSDWAFNPLDARTYDVQFDLYQDAIDATPHGKFLHIGGDEVHTTGRESGKSSLELQLIWLNKVCKFAEEQGRTPIFWDDMPLKFANVYRPMFNPSMSEGTVDSIWAVNESKLLEFIDEFPKNCIYMRWNYQQSQTYGNLKAMDWFTSHDLKVMGATAGQTRWTLMPQNQSNIPQIKSFALSSIEKGLDGLLLTLWDDDSPHFELYMRGIMSFAEYSWAGDQKSIEDVIIAHRHRAFGAGVSNEEYAFINALENPVSRWRNILVEEKQNRNRLVSMDGEGGIEIPDSKNRGAWSIKYADRIAEAKRLVSLCDSISHRIEASKNAAIRNKFTLEIYEQVNELIKFNFQALITLENYDKASSELEGAALKDVKELPTKFDALRNRFETVYAKSRILNKPDNYILDQDHHFHSANQTVSFDWQFVGEMALLRKISNDL